MLTGRVASVVVVQSAVQRPSRLRHVAGWIIRYWDGDNYVGLKCNVNGESCFLSCKLEILSSHFTWNWIVRLRSSDRVRVLNGRMVPPVFAGWKGAFCAMFGLASRTAESEQ